MHRNAALYPWYTALFGAMAWIPIFFLFFSQYLSLEQVLRLEAIYYAAVVLLEVPSGYFSDVVGRRATLLVSSAAMVLAYGFFLITDGFWLFAVGQFLLAVGFAFKSGTDTSFHYDSLAALGQSNRYGEREAIAGRNGLVSTAFAIFLGGFVGLFSLRLAYAVSLFGAFGALIVVLSFREPPAQDHHEESTSSGSLIRLAKQLRLCLGYARQPGLLWLLAFAILMTILNHIPYEFYQPYLTLLSTDVTFFAERTSLVAGFLAGSSTLLGAWVAAYSIWLRDRIGLGSTLLLATCFQLLLISAMALWLHPIVVPLILLRTLPLALMAAPLNTAIAPQVPQAQRATYLSMQSLAGRLAFSGVLMVLSVGSTTGLITESASRGAVDWPALAWMLRANALLGLVGLVLLFLMRKMVRDL